MGEHKPHVRGLAKSRREDRQRVFGEVVEVERKRGTTPAEGHGGLIDARKEEGAEKVGGVFRVCGSAEVGDDDAAVLDVLCEVVRVLWLTQNVAQNRIAIELFDPVNDWIGNVGLVLW
jgi:hypothetical protein